MRIIFLNAYQGKVTQPITDFIARESQNTDVFCFQETIGKMATICKQNLKNFDYFNAQKPKPDGGYSLSTFTKEPYKIIDNRALLLDISDAGFVIYTKVQVGDMVVHICNVHGAPEPGDKLDNEVRLKQSKEILDFMASLSGPKIIGGDFNIDIDAKSIGMFEKQGYKNLIKEFCYATTRDDIAWDKYPNSRKLFSDYVFVNSEVKVDTFEVLNVEVSDHLPMVLEIELPGKAN